MNNSAEALFGVQPNKEELKKVLQVNAITLATYFAIIRATPFVIDVVKAIFQKE